MEIRQKVESSFPQADQVDATVAIPEVEPPPPPLPPKPVIELGDLTIPPTLKSYGEVSPKGAEHLIKLARALEDKGEFQRALLSWERVMDLTKADGNQLAAAVSSVKRLRPTLPDWNMKPETAIQIELHAGTGSKLATKLTPVLEEMAGDLQKASSGILKVKAIVTAGKSSRSSKSPTPVALWLTGPGKKATSTEVLSFTADSPEKLKEEVAKTVFSLVRTYLGKSTAFTPPIAIGDEDKAPEALNDRITRLCWSEFGTFLNLPQK